MSKIRFSAEIEVGAVAQCPACGEMIVVHDALGRNEAAASFADEGVACNAECGALFDVEWTASRELGGGFSASVTRLTARS